MGDPAFPATEAGSRGQLGPAVNSRRADRWATVLATILVFAIALAGAVYLPVRFGPLIGQSAHPSIRGYLVLGLCDVFAAWLAAFLARRGALSLGLILALAALTRLAFLAARVATGSLSLDQDMSLYLQYGQALLAGHYPDMEYPQGALLLFAALAAVARLASSNVAAGFAFVLPLAMLVCDLALIASLFWLAGPTSGGVSLPATGTSIIADRRPLALTIAAVYALTPFTLLLWSLRFDSAAASLLALGLVLFALDRPKLSALALAAGCLIKWFPAVAVPFLLVSLLRERRWRSATELAGVFGGVVAAVALPFLVASPAAFIHTYLFHATRPLMGESLLYLPARYLLGGARIAPGGPPWSEVGGGLLTSGAATVLQMAALGVLLFLAVRFGRDRWSAVVFGAVGATLFILLNRVFSPQYVVTLLAAFGVSLIALRPGTKRIWVAPPLLVALTLANYLVWPVWWTGWLTASALFHGLCLLLAGYLTLRACRD